MQSIRYNDRGAAVEDVQRRLRVLGYDLKVDGEFGPNTREVVRAFREAEQLPAGDVVDGRAWSALVDASFSLGDRMLYLRMPFFHGGDVRMLQQILDVLGFATGGADGIFGAHTERALRDFQASVGLTDDGIAGASTYDAITRLKHAWEGKQPAGSEADEHIGFARAAEVLERVEACFFGMDEMGRGVASRVANLAWATNAAARVTSADALGDVAVGSLLKVGVCCGQAPVMDGVPVVALREGGAFVKHLRIALASADPDTRRVVVEVPEQGVADDGTVMMQDRFQQHLAVVLLDAFCNALR